jgi:hypothetical protein
MKPTTAQIDKVLNQCADAQEHGTHFFGMTYEDGVDAAIRWMLGEDDENPMEGYVPHGER